LIFGCRLFLNALKYEYWFRGNENMVTATLSVKSFPPAYPTL